MKCTADELIDIWKYFQYCCLPSIIMAKYAYQDYIDDIKKEKAFYRHETKQAINRIGKILEKLPNQLMATSNANVRYMNILGDNIEELFEEEENELHKSIYLTFRNAKMNKKAETVVLNNPRCLKAIHEIRKKLSDIETLCIAMRKSYPWSPNYKEDIPFEQSDDYLIVYSNNQQT